MAQFTLTINTDDAFELSTIAAAVASAASGDDLLSAVVDKARADIAEGRTISSDEFKGQLAERKEALQAPVADTAAAPAPVAEAAPAPAPVAEAAPAPTPVAEVAPAPAPEPTPEADGIPERDAHGLKRDLSIHSEAKEPLDRKGLWKRRRNLEDDFYDEKHENLVREAMAAGVYTGPVIPALTLENRVAEMAPPPPPAPAGMSAQDTPTGPKVIQTLVTAAGARSAQVMLKALGAKSVMEVPPQDLRNWMEIAEAVKAMAIAPADKATAGVQAMATIAGDYGYDCSGAL